MLYDKRWEKKAETKPAFSLDTLIAWLEKQEADRVYCYQDNGGCLFAQYFSEHGYASPSCGGNYVRESEKRDQRDWFPRGWDMIAAEFPRTFGAALERARKLQAS